MKRTKLRLAAATVTLVGCFLVACSDQQRGSSNGAGSRDSALAFDAAEAEFKALAPLLSMVAEEKAKAIVRQRLVVAAMIMRNCAERGVSVTRERPNDGFERRIVTAEWIRPYVEQASEYPEWNDRNALVTGVLSKTSG